MSKPAAKQNDKIIAVDTHIVMVPAPPAPPVPTPVGGHVFNGIIDGGLSGDVFINRLPAATKGSTATNTPAHLPMPPGISFAPPGPTNRGTIEVGSGTVFINGKAAARAGDSASTCDDLDPSPKGQVVVAGASTVFIGG